MANAGGILDGLVAAGLARFSTGELFTIAGEMDEQPEHRPSGIRFPTLDSV